MSKPLHALLCTALLACILGAGLTACSTEGGTMQNTGTTTDTKTTAPDTTGTNAGAGSVDATYIIQNEGAFTLVDVRTTAEFAAGHIPGAVNVEYSSSPCTGASVGEEQRELYAKAGINPDTPLVLYCRTGARAQAAADILRDEGFSNVRVYTGSWTDWTSDPSRPIEQ